MIDGSSYEALLIDLDGTLLDARGEIRPRNLASLHALRERGVTVMVATGRSSVAARPAVAPLALETPILVFNGAGLYCLKRGRLIEERVLSNQVIEEALLYGERSGLLTVVQQDAARYSTPPRDELEASAVQNFSDLQAVPRSELPREHVIRVSWLSRDHETSTQLAAEVLAAIDQPVYSTDFPLRLLAGHEQSPYHVVDIHPPCRGKAEGLRYLQEERGIEPHRVVAIGDATNDIPMMEAAGLGVAMGSGMKRAIAAADRVIGGHDSDAIAELVEELWKDRAR